MPELNVKEKEHAHGSKGELTNADIDRIIEQAVKTANATDSALRVLPAVQKVKMQIAVVARDGKLLRLHSMPDAWLGSIDIAVAKARTAAFFSSDQNALTSRVIGQLSRTHQPDGSSSAAPLWGIWASNQVGISGNPEHRNGIVPFPGGVPLYKGGKLAGGVGVSGDAVDPDEVVALGAAAGFEPGPDVAKLGLP